MGTVTSAKPVRRRLRNIAGITADAAALGCSRQHLALCLRGERKGSAELMARYHALKISQMQPAKGNFSGGIS